MFLFCMFLTLKDQTWSYNLTSLENANQFLSSSPLCYYWTIKSFHVNNNVALALKKRRQNLDKKQGYQLEWKVLDLKAATPSARNVTSIPLYASYSCHFISGPVANLILFSNQLLRG